MVQIYSSRLAFKPWIYINDNRFHFSIVFPYQDPKPIFVISNCSCRAGKYFKLTRFVCRYRYHMHHVSCIYVVIIQHFSECSTKLVPTMIKTGIASLYTVMAKRNSMTHDWTAFENNLFSTIEKWWLWFTHNVLVLQIQINFIWTERTLVLNNKIMTR